jgi:fatty acid desaturase
MESVGTRVPTDQPQHDDADPPDAAVSRGSPFSQLLHGVKKAGLLERRSRYYAWKITLTAALWVGGWVAFVMIGDSWWQVGVAVFFAVIFTQLGFLGHDAGHRQVFGSRRANHVIGVMLANLAIGLSYGWWIDKHSRHHAHPNDEDKDPDIGVGAFVFTTAQAKASRGFSRWRYRYQAYAFFPLLLLEAINLRVASIRYLAGRDERRRAREVLLLGAHMAAYLIVVFVVLSPIHAVVFVAVHQGLFGLYMGCSFAPNHKGMPTLSHAEENDFLRRQVLTSRNVRGGWFVDLALGGLNYQIEHHLFPSMPRPNLRRAQLLVRAYCAEHGVPYTQTSLIDSYRQALRHLNTVGRSMLPASTTSTAFAPRFESDRNYPPLALARYA